MLRAACHCTAVRFEVAVTPEWVLDCNCTLCRRYGALWVYPQRDQVTFISGEQATDTYIWNGGGLAFHRCRTCGCITHMMVVEDPPWLYGINGRMIPTLDPRQVRVVQKDNGHTGWFWTRSDEQPQGSHHPKMDPPAPEDWR